MDKKVKIVRHVTVSENEIEIIKLLADGLMQKEVGVMLSTPHRTINTRVYMMLKKFECRNVAQLVAFALRNDVIK